MTGAEIIGAGAAGRRAWTDLGYSGGAIRRPTRDLPPQPVQSECGAASRCRASCRPTAGRGLCGRAMRAQRPRRRVRRDVRAGATNTVTPGRDCAADSVPIVVICGQVPRRPRSAATRSRKRPSQHHGRVAKHCFLVTDPDAPRGDGAHGVRDRPHRSPGTGGHRVPKDCRTGRACSGARTPRPCALSPSRMNALRSNARPRTSAGRSSDARRLRAGSSIRCASSTRGLRRAAQGSRRPRHPVVTTLMASAPSTPSTAVDEHARHARRAFATTPWTTATS